MARAEHVIAQHDVGDIKPKEKSLLDVTIDKITTKNSKDLIYVRSTTTASSLTAPEERPSLPPDPIIPAKPVESFKPTEEPSLFEKPTYLPAKPISHSPKISPSSIPNPSPSVATSKPMEQGYPNYGSYLYSIPGYSAFQPVSYPGVLPQPPITQNETSNTEFTPFPITKENAEDKVTEVKTIENQTSKSDLATQETDFEEHFTPEIVPAISVTEQTTKNLSESKLSITSLTQGAGATVTIPSPILNKETKKKQVERFSLKTSIPISKIDMKCVGNPPDTILVNSVAKNALTTFNPAFQNTKPEGGSKVEIQSNIIIKSASKEPEVIETKQIVPAPNNMNTLINAAEAVNNIDRQFKKPEPKTEVINEIKDPPPSFTPTTTNITRPVYNPINIDADKANFPPKQPEGNFNEQKNQILFIQNKTQNPKMLLTIQQQNPQVLLQRTNFESKNAQVPSRLSSQSKKCKEDIAENGTSSKVVALKRLHQENCDENDFENLITENQIYGNKIVVKEKSQGTLQEQDLKNKKANEKSTQETKNVVLQPNFLYLSNVQFPANLMMIKNNAKINQNADLKANKVTPNENKVTNEASTMTNSNDINATKNAKPQNVSVSKEIHVLKSSNNVLQTLSNKNSKTDLVFQTPHQKVIMNSQIVYQVPMIVDGDNKITNQPIINREYPKLIGQNKKEYTKQFEQKPNDKLYIACPYQMDSKLQPKIVITNLRHKITKIDEISSLDIYEKRRRMRRLKYLSNRENKDIQKTDVKKTPDKTDPQRNIITPDKMREEICKEFSNTKIQIDDKSSESESDYGEDDLAEYESIIKDYRNRKEKSEDGKAEFLAHFRLATHKVYQEKQLDRQERSLSKDSVASAYITAGRLDRLTNEVTPVSPVERERIEIVREENWEEMENGVTLQTKHTFLTQLKLKQVTPQHKEGYERIWQEILKERKRRDGITETKEILKQPKLKSDLELDPNGQLQILTEIKKSVNENNNLIKKKLDSSDSENVTEGDSIHILAEKNFSELNRLSKMADISVKLITGQDARKRDLNPGFDSENIKKPALKVEQPFQNYPQINIPNISKIISLKTDNASCQTPLQMTSQATSMDEPMNSAAGLEVDDDARVKDFGCQVNEVLPWPGLEAVLRSYKEYEAARKREINEGHRRNTALRVEGAHITRAASRDSDRARALLAERQHLVNEEAAVRRSLQTLSAAIDAVRNY